MVIWHITTSHKFPTRWKANCRYSTTPPPLRKLRQGPNLWLRIIPHTNLGIFSHLPGGNQLPIITVWPKLPLLLQHRKTHDIVRVAIGGLLFPCPEEFLSVAGDVEDYPNGGRHVHYFGGLLTEVNILASVETSISIAIFQLQWNFRKFVFIGRITTGRHDLPNPRLICHNLVPRPRFLHLKHPKHSIIILRPCLVPII